MRHRDWLSRMWAELNTADTMHFEFGSFDCVRMAAKVVDSIRVDSHMLDKVSDLYSNKRQAVRLIMKEGLDYLVTRELGTMPVARALARQGDVVSVDLPTGPAIGICVGFQVAVAAAPSGVSYMSMAQAHAAWMID